MKKIIFATIAVAAAFTACSNEDYLGGNVNRDGAGVAISSLTAQMGSSASDRSWSEGDKIAVSVSYYDLTAQNRAYICGADGKSFTPETGDPIYIKGATSVVAYWPFTGTDSAEPNFEINTTDQDALQDYLFAKTEGVNTSNGSAVALTFERVLADFEINITAADDVIKSWTLTGVNTEAVVNTYTLDLSLGGNTEILLGSSDEAITKIALRLLPQVLSTTDGEVTLTLLGQNRTYTFTLNDEQALTLVSAKKTTCDVNIADGRGTIEFVPAGTVDWTEN